MEIDFDSLSEQKRSLITTKLLGKAIIPNVPFVSLEGTPYRLETDYFGKKRDLENPIAGPFNVEDEKRVQLRVWPRN
jgi:alpha-N-arabinofuranosidase